MNKREILVIDMETNEVIHRVDVTGRSDDHVERAMRGMLINLNERCRIEDTDWKK